MKKLMSLMLGLSLVLGSAAHQEKGRQEDDQEDRVHHEDRELSPLPVLSRWRTA